MGIKRKNLEARLKQTYRRPPELKFEVALTPHKMRHSAYVKQALAMFQREVEDSIRVSFEKASRFIDLPDWIHRTCVASFNGSEFKFDDWLDYAACEQFVPHRYRPVLEALHKSVVMHKPAYEELLRSLPSEFSEIQHNIYLDWFGRRTLSGRIEEMSWQLRIPPVPYLIPVSTLRSQSRSGKYSELLDRFELYWTEASVTNPKSAVYAGEKAYRWLRYWLDEDDWVDCPEKALTVSFFTWGDDPDRACDVLGLPELRHWQYAQWLWATAAFYSEKLELAEIAIRNYDHLGTPRFQAHEAAPIESHRAQEIIQNNQYWWRARIDRNLDDAKRQAVKPATVAFNLSSVGDISKLRILKSSGDDAVDEDALNAFRYSSPLTTTYGSSINVRYRLGAVHSIKSLD